MIAWLDIKRQAHSPDVSAAPCLLILPILQISLQCPATLSPPAATRRASANHALPCPLAHLCPLPPACLPCPWLTFVQCLVPPGYFVNTGFNPPRLAKCSTDPSTGQGYYRAGWVAAGQASGPDAAAACTACGRDIPSALVEPDESSVTLGQDDTRPGFVSSSASSCCKYGKAVVLCGCVRLACLRAS